MKKAFFSTFVILILVGCISYGVVLYAKGYRLDFSNKGNQFVAGTGLLVLTSVPNGGRVFIDGNLTTATDNTINLSPGTYSIRIEKDGYFAWSKKVTVKKESVTKTDALLFPSTPKLEAITVLGSANPIIDPTNTLIAYSVSSSTAEQNGIYILTADNRPILSNGTSNTQIASDLQDRFSKANYEFSPDGKQLLATITLGRASSTSANQTVYLLDTNRLNTTPQNVTVRVKQIKEQWAVLQKALDDKFISSLPKKVQPLALTNFANISISPERDKIMYTASISAQMPLTIVPPLPSTNSTLEDRNLVAGNVYVYQIKEDKNYLLYAPAKGEILPEFMWHPSSAHVVFVKDKKIQLMEFDGGNRITVYSGPFDGFFYPWPNGAGIVIRTNFNDESNPPNLYRIGIR